MKVLTAENMREIERIAIQDKEIPSLLLMENAALALCRHCLSVLEEIHGKSVLIICGKGNNGGDGAALARLLFVKGVKVKVLYLCEPEETKNDAQTNYKILKKLGIPTDKMPILDTAFLSRMIHESDLIVDALFGTGLDRTLSDFYCQAIGIINQSAKYILAVDVPSGIHSDNGQLMGAAVRAHKTVTFFLGKQGLYLNPACEYVGEIAIEDITIPSDITEKVEVTGSVFTEKEVKALLPKRFFRSHKGSYGKVYVIAGCREMTGAAVLSSSAAYRVGAGWVCCCGTEPVIDILHRSLPEAVTMILPDENGFLCKKSFERLAKSLSQAKSIVLGPGLGLTDSTCALVENVLIHAKASVVIDADALNAAAQNPAILQKLQKKSVVTPHPTEMSRLSGQSVEEILNHPIETTVNFARKYQVVTLLKDSRTIVADPSGEFYINLSGSPAMAKAGTGDVLSGVIGGLIAQGLEPFTAAKLGAYLHGKAGETAADDLSLYGVNAADVVQVLPKVLKAYSS